MSVDTEKSSSDETYFNLICNHVVDLALSLNAHAVFLVGDIEFKSDKLKGIPVIAVNSVLPSVFERLKATEDRSLLVEEYADAVVSNADDSISLIHSVAALEYILGNVSNGYILGFVKKESFYSIVVHDISDNKIVRLVHECENRVAPGVFNLVIKLAIKISTQGREGNKIGTAFIIGDEDEVMRRSHQMILNPYLLQDPTDCNILNKENWESVLGFAQLDGVFIVSAEGSIISAGRYLDVDANSFKIGKGFGSRHISAASITRDTNAIAVVISQSGGIIRCYMDGKEVLMIDPFSSKASMPV
ncbi:MAG: diadenylate cyclase [Methanosarcinaceae archaeon]|nr:diadenylate cyclase [Methanosarcinaceae archaeon]